MNKTIKILAALLPLFITSCTNDDANVTTTPQQDPVVTLSAGITRGEGETGTTNTEPDPFSYNKIKVINVTRQGKGLPYSQAVFTKNTSGTTATWTSDSPLLWCGGMENTFHAVYPATADYSSFTVPADQSTEDGLKSADWMTGEAKATLNNLTSASPLDINMTRKMAMVEIEIKTGRTIDSNHLLVVESPSYEGTDNIIFETNDNKINAYRTSNSEFTFSSIIPPGSKSKDAILCRLYRKNNESPTLVNSYKLNSDIIFQSGKKYKFKFTPLSFGGSAPTRSAAPNNLTLVSVEPM